MALFIWILILLFAILFLTFIHELGHFLVAKWCGVRVAEFSIGFGPAMCQIKRNSTTYSLRWLPFGGYVSVLSDDVVVEIQRIQKMVLTPEQEHKLKKQLKGLTLYEDYSKQKTLDKISTPKKIAFALGGLTMNLLAAFAILFTMNVTIGNSVSTNNSRHLQNYPFAITGEQVDKVLKVEVDGIRIMQDYFKESNNDFEECSDEYGTQYYCINDFDDYYEIMKNPDKYLKTIEIESPGAKKEMIDVYSIEILSSYHLYDSTDFDNEVPITEGFVYINYISPASKFAVGSITINYSDWMLEDEDKTIDNKELIWITQSTLSREIILEKNTVLEGLGNAFVETFEMLGEAFLWIANILSFYALNDYLNPYSEYADISVGTAIVYSLFNLLALFSLLLLAFNIMPIPPLDGWKVCEFSYEGITKKKIKPETSQKLNKIGWIIIMVVIFVPFFFSIF